MTIIWLVEMWITSPGLIIFLKRHISVIRSDCTDFEEGNYEHLQACKAIAVEQGFVQILKSPSISLLIFSICCICNLIL